MLSSELDYDLPPELIAQQPVTPRDHSRLLVYDRSTQRQEHRRLTDLLSHLNPGDTLAFNDSRVLRARVHALRTTGGKVELLFLQRRRVRLWEALVKPSARLHEGEELRLVAADAPGAGSPGAGNLRQGLVFGLKQNLGGGRWLVKNLTSLPTEEILEAAGEMPLPPYIKAPLEDAGLYQTVYARQPGSAAAPTAGLHFTPELIGRIRAAGVSLAPLTLHIGLDTFRPVGEDELEQHEIHSEAYDLPRESYEEIIRTKERGGKVVAVGTTAVRVLETVFQGFGGSPKGSASPFEDVSAGQLSGETSLFIIPGYRFRAVDSLLTNFHLPRSTLLALVMAFAGVRETRRLYADAVRERYRFFSFGDAMLIL